MTFCCSDDEKQLYLERAQSLNNFYEVCNKKRESDLGDCNILLNLFLNNLVNCD